MSEGKWVEAKHEDIREGDVVRVTRKITPQTTITEGKVTLYKEHGAGLGTALWNIEDFENFYDYEFVPDSEGYVSTLERFVPPFKWPTKLGAVVTGKDEDGTYKIVLVEELPDDPEGALWWTSEWGTVNRYDMEGLDDLTVVSEGVTVKV